MSATFMEVLDTTVVNVSLPHIAARADDAGDFGVDRECRTHHAGRHGEDESHQDDPTTDIAR
jgi:hypothetical protein